MYTIELNWAQVTHYPFIGQYDFRYSILKDLII